MLPRDLWHAMRYINTCVFVREQNDSLLFAHYCTYLSPGQSPPALVEFSLNLDPPEQLLLTFTSSVEPSTCDVQAVTLQSSAVLSQNDASYTFGINGSCFQGSAGSVVAVDASVEDWSAVQGDINLATSIANTFLSLAGDFIMDGGGMSNVEISSSSAIPVASFTENPNPPFLFGFGIDLNNGFLGLVFTQGIDSATANLTGVQLSYTNATTNLPEILTFSELNTLMVLDPGVRVAISFDTTQLFILKLSLEPYSLSLAADSFIGGNGLMNLQQTGVQSFGVFADEIPPVLVRFVLDLNSEVIIFEFDEPMSLQSANFSGVYVMGTMQNFPSGFNISGSLILSDDVFFTVITAALSVEDVNAVKSDPTVCSMSANCFVFLDNSSFSDVAGNGILSSPTSITVLPVEYIPDVTPPELTSFSLDLNTGIVALTFTEPIDTVNFDGSVVTIQNSAQSSTVALGSATIGSTTDFDTVLLLDVSSVLNELKILVTTFGSIVFLSMESSAANDTSGNSVVPISTLFVTTVLVDVTPPSMVSFVPSDPVDPQIVFFFDEYVISSSWNGNRVVLALPTAQGTFNYSGLTQGVIEGSDMDSIAYNFSESEFIPPLSDYYSNGYYGGQFGISAAMGLVTDLSGNALMPSFLIYNSELPDTFNPILRSFSLDMNAGIITLIFSEAVNVTNAGGMAITLQNSFTLTATQVYIPTGSSVSSPSLDIVSIVLNISDLNILKELTDLATSVANSYIVVEPTFATDLSGNPLTALIVGLQASNFVADSQGPVVESFQLDLDANVLSVQFDEPVQFPTFFLTGITLTDSNQSVNSVGLQSVVGTSLVSSTEIAIVITMNDIFRVKDQAICTDETDCFAAFNSALIQDTNNNPSMSTESPLPVSSLTLDVTQPQFLDFSIDMNTGMITLQFDEPMSLDAIDFSSVYLTGTSQTSPSGISLNGSVISSTEIFSTELIAALSVTALNAVKNDGAVCTFRLNCFIFIAESSFFDVSGNEIDSLASGTVSSALVVDTTPPLLQSFALDLDSGLVILTFDEPVNVGTFDPFGISILNSNQTASVNLENAATQAAESSNTVLSLAVNNSVLNEMKGFVAMNSSVFITLQSLTVSDTNGNPIQLTSPQLVQSIIEDVTAPNLLQFIPSTPDMRRMTFLFDEFVDSSSWSGDRLTLSLLTAQGTFNYSGFTQGMFNSSDTDVFTYAFSDDEFVRPFSTDYTIAYNGGLFELFTTDGLLADLNGNPLLAITTPLTFNNSVGDTLSPILTAFALDLNTGMIMATFSEEISVIAVGNRVRLQNSVTQPANTYTLQQNSSVASDLMISGAVSITIARSDLNQLKLNMMLATSVTDTYLVLLASFATDLSGNPLAAQSQGLQASGFVPDTEGPMVLAFDLDLDADIMILQFDEPVRVSSFEHTTITLTNNDVSPGNLVSVQLANVEVIHESSEMVEELRFLLGINESILVKSQPLCYTTADCFVLIGDGLVSDVYGNPSVALVTPLQIESFTPDVSPPRLISFSELDLDAGTFTLIFSEPVNTSTVQFEDIQFVDDPFTPTVNVTLTQGSTTPDHIEVEFFLTNEDLNRIKVSPELCTDNTNCWIRLPSFFINDIGNNPFLHSNFGMDAQASFDQPLSFIPDTTRPQVQLFSVDLNIGNLVIRFNEVVLDTTFTASEVTLLNAASGSISLSLSNATSFVRSATGDEIRIFFTLTDLNRLKRSSSYTSGNDSFLSLTTATLSDTSGNILVSILPMNAVQVSMYIEDVTGPVLTSFDLFNIDNGTFIISFDEPIDVASTQLDLITFLSGPGSLNAFTLTGGLVEYLDECGLALVVTLSNADRTRLKLLSGLATSDNSTYIAVESGAVQDTAGNANVPISAAEPLQLSPGNFVLDTSPAMLSSFDLDLDGGVLTLSFTDVIVVSSIDLTQLTLQSSQQNASVFQNLRSGTSSSTDSDTIAVLLSEVDLNALKINLELAIDVATTFVSFTSDFVLDIEGRNVIEVPSNASIPVGVFTPDTTSPLLVSFSLDMNTGVVEFTFSEPVYNNSISTVNIAFQNGQTANSSLALGEATVETDELATLTVTVALTFGSLNMLKSTANLATALTDSYINITSAFATDTNGNSIEPTVQIAAVYVPDTVPPELLYFNINLTLSPFTSTLRMKFSEAVQFSSAVQTSISFRSSRSSGAIMLQLTPQDQVSLLALDEIQIVIASVSASLLNDPMIGASVDTLFLSLSGGAVSDFSNIPAVEIPPESALRVSLLCKFTFIVVLTKPQLI